MKTALSLEAIKAIKANRKGQQLDFRTINAVKTELIDLIDATIAGTIIDTNKTRYEDAEMLSIIGTGELTKVEAYLTLNFNGRGASTISLETQSLPTAGQEKLEAFKASPAYKRYFELFDNDKLQLTATISERQLTSRHFVEYVSHIIDQMEPFVSLLSAQRFAHRKAA